MAVGSHAIAADGIHDDQEEVGSRSGSNAGLGMGRPARSEADEGDGEQPRPHDCRGATQGATHGVG